MENVKPWIPVPRRVTMDAVWCPRCGQNELQEFFAWQSAWLVCGCCGHVEQHDEH